MNATTAERQELERAVELLGRSTRHGRLLAYLGEKYFQGQETQLTEFNLATEFFGRSADRFDAGQDAVVRVEVHRLRKKLRDLYEKGAGPHGLQISLPAGSYVPQFSRIAESRIPGDPALIAEAPAVDTPPAPEPDDNVPSPPRGNKRLAFVLLAIAVVAAASVGVWVFSTRTETSHPPAVSSGSVPVP